MSKSKLLYVTLASSLAILSTACGAKKTDSSNQPIKFSQAVPHKPIKKGGTLTYALENESPFTGIFSAEIADTSPDSEAAAPGDEALFDINDHYQFTNKGAASLKLNHSNNTAEIKVKKKVRWSDGKPVTAKDLEYAYEILANPKVQTTQYTSSLENIKGMAEYHRGKANNISGLEMPDGPNGKKLILHFKELKPAMMNSANGFFWEHAYWRGKPNFEHIYMSNITNSNVSQAIKSKKFDVANVLSSQWEQVKNTKGVNFVGKKTLSYDYLAFKVGNWDAKLGKNVENPHAKMNNPALRKAMAYAMNVDVINKRFYRGLEFRINSLIPSQFTPYYDKNIPTYSYNLDKANKLLDKAGYKKAPGALYRSQPNGKPLVINLAVRGSGENSEAIWRNYIQQWKKAGLNVKFLGGRPMEFNRWVAAVKASDPKIDVLEGAWGAAGDPSPSVFYGEKMPYNFARFVSPTNTKLLNEIDSAKSFDKKYRVQKFHEWQKWMYNKAYVVPTSGAYSVTAVNSKVSGWSLKPSANVWYEAGFTK